MRIHAAPANEKTALDQLAHANKSIDVCAHALTFDGENVPFLVRNIIRIGVTPAYWIALRFVAFRTLSFRLVLRFVMLAMRYHG